MKVTGSGTRPVKMAARQRLRARLACRLLLAAVAAYALALSVRSFCGGHVTADADAAAGHVTGRAPARRLSESRRGVKKLLFWTPYFGSPTWDFDALGTAPFRHELCPLQCFATTDRRHLADVDAVVVNYADADLADWPANVSRRQLTVLVVDRPPPDVGVGLYRFEGLVQFVMSYRRDSDIHAPYRVVRPAPRPTSGYRPRVPLAARNRTAVWIADRCSTPSRREDYVRELARYVDVDVYGACGARSCPDEPSGACMAMVESTYKFYLAFEDSVCRDYVTDELFQTLRWDVVPVVLGGADYAKELALGSPAVINAMDFDGPKELARFLAALSHDERRYDAYFENKLKYRIVPTNGALTGGLCRFCSWLYGRRLVDAVQYRDDLAVWWNVDACTNEFVGEQLRSR